MGEGKGSWWSGEGLKISGGRGQNYSRVQIGLSITLNLNAKFKTMSVLFHFKFFKLLL